MRRIWILLATAVVGAGCHCGQKLSTQAPKLVITQPAERDGGEWVLDFGAVTAPGTYTGNIVVENHGAFAGTVQTAALRAGSDPALTLSTGSLPAAVPPSGSLTLTVTYQPTAVGPAVGYVDLSTDDPQLPTATVMIVASAQAGQAQVCVEGTDGGWQCTGPRAQSLAIDFGTVQVGTSTSRNVQVRNIGTSPLSYTGAGLSGGPTEFAITPAQNLPNGGVAISPGEVASFEITFAPTGPGAAADTATVTTSDPGGPWVAIQLAGQAVLSVNCDLQVNPTHVDFGSVPNNGPANQSLVVVNVGGQPCHVSGLPFTGSAAFALSSPPTLPDTLATNGVLTLDVQYTPSGTNTDNGTLTVNSDDPVHPAIAVPLSATSIAPPPCQLVASPPQLSFGPLHPGNRQLEYLGLTAVGSDVCTINSISLAQGDTAFSWAAQLPLLVSNNGGPGPGFGGPASIPVSYAPAVARADADTLKISYTPGFSFPPQTLTLTVPLRGVAGSPQLCILPNQLHYGNVAVGQTKDLSFQMTACGTSNVNVTSITLETADAGFVLPPPLPTLPEAVTLGGGQVGQAVRFAPTSTAAVSTRAHVVSDDPLYPDQYVLLDTAPETPCVLQVTPPSVNFGVLMPNSAVQKQVVFTNAGTGTCNLTNFTLNGAAAGFSLVGAPTSLAIASGQSSPALVVQANLPPGSPSQRTGSVTFNSNDANQPTVSIPLSAFLQSSGPYSQGWPKLYLDNNNSSRSLSDTSSVTGKVLWTFQMTPPPTNFDGGQGGLISNPCLSFTISPVVGPDGTVYQLDLFGTLHAIDPSGNQIWQNATPFAISTIDPFGATPFLAADGTIYLTGGSDGAGTPTMYHLSGTGSVLQTALASNAGQGDDAGDGYDVAPLLSSSGWVYAFDDFPDVIIYDHDLNQQAVIGIPAGDERAGLALGADDSSFWNFSGALTRLNPPDAGWAQAWEYNGGSTFGGTALGAAVSLNPVTGQVLMSSAWLGLAVGTGVAALDPATGAEKWHRQLPTHAATKEDTDPTCQLFVTDIGNSAPTVGADGTIYIGNWDGMYALDGTTGATQPGWPVATAAVTDTASIGGDGALFFGTLDGTFWGLNADGSVRFKVKTGGRISSSPAIGPDGTVYFVSDDGSLYAVH